MLFVRLPPCHVSLNSFIFLSVQDKDDEDEDLEHGKAHDDMWCLDLKKYTVSLLSSLNLASCQWQQHAQQ